MIAELGNFSLAAALAVSIVLFVLPLMGAHYGRASWMQFARSATYAQALLVALSYAFLTYAFYINDFSVAYVAKTSNLAQPLAYRLTGVWGGHEGSLLLWILMLSAWATLVALFSRGIPQDMIARVLAVLGGVSIGFIAFTLFTSNPFDRLLPAPVDGQELNPLLQDPGFFIHPPMLYMGYVGLSVVFAFAIAAMLSSKLDMAWARWARPWTTVAWLFLTVGIVLGSWWAYYELGWGGWWFWDPVENASFMPWLVATALMHSLAVTEKRGAFKAWTALLAILAFSLSLLGTFLVRSGVLTSVHSFATDPTRGMFILVFLILVVGGSLGLYALRAHRLNSNVQFGFFSKESNLLLNNIFLVITAFVVLIGTLAPILYDAFDRKISVGAPYFDFMFVLLMTPLAMIIGLGSNSRWKKDSLQRFNRDFLVLGVITLLVTVGCCYLISGAQTTIGSFAGTALAIWVAVWSTVTIRDRLKNQKNKWRGLVKIPASIWGMVIAHIGVAVFIFGVVNVSSNSLEKDVRLLEDQSYQMGNYTFEFQGMRRVQGPNYQADEGVFKVTSIFGSEFFLYPQKRFYSSSNPMTEAAINTGISRDVYVSLGDELEDGAWSVRIYIRSFVAWIWLGGFLMALGGVVAVFDKRFRRPISFDVRQNSVKLEQV